MKNRRKQMNSSEFKEQSIRIRTVNELALNSLRVAKWSDLILKKLTSSPDFSGKEELLKDMQNMLEFMSYNTVESSNNLSFEMIEELYEYSNTNDVRKFQDIFELEHQISDGVLVSDIKEFAFKEGELEDLAHDLVNHYLNSDDEKSKLFLSLYVVDKDECYDVVLGHMSYWRELNNEELMSIDIEESTRLMGYK
jgi:hypothetical protein